MTQSYLAIYFLATVMLAGCTTTATKTVDVEQRPIPRLAYHETQSPPGLAHLDVRSEYYIWLCIDESDAWEFDFLIAYFLNNPRMILSNVWSPGFRFDNGWYQKIQIDGAFLEYGNVHLDAMFESKNSNDTWAIGVDIGGFLKRNDIREYAIDREQTFFAASHPCAHAKPLEDRFLKRSFGARIH